MTFSRHAMPASTIRVSAAASDRALSRSCIHAPHRTRTSLAARILVAVVDLWSRLHPRLAAPCTGRRTYLGSSILAARAGRCLSASAVASGEADDSIDTSDEGGSDQDAVGRKHVVELQQAIELELGRQHRLATWPKGLGKVLAMYPNVDLRLKVEGLKVAVGLEEAAALLWSYPQLLVKVKLSEVPPRLDTLAAALGTDRKGALGLCTRTKSAAQILQMQPGRVQDTVEALCSALQLARKQLLQLCCKYPTVLEVDPAVVRTRMAALGQELGLDTAQTAQLCQKSPYILKVPTDTVVAVVEAMQVVLGVSREEALQLCLRTPSVLHKSPADVKATAAALKLLLSMQGRDLGECMILFGVPTAQIAPRLEALQATLGVTQAEALLLVQDAPRLLLTQSYTLKQGWGELQRAARERPEWREQIGNWTASNLSGCLGSSTRMRQRMDAVLSLGREAEQLPALSPILKLTEPQFQAMLQRVLSGEFKKQIRPLKNPDRAMRVRHPGLWRQLKSWPLRACQRGERASF